MSVRKLDSSRPAKFETMKKLFELLVCFLHPIAVVLMWLDLATRTDIARGSKLAGPGLVPQPGRRDRPGMRAGHRRAARR